jgi:hypothetical protein
VRRDIILGLIFGVTITYVRSCYPEGCCKYPVSD